MLSALAAAVSLVIPARLADPPLNAARAVRLGAAAPSIRRRGRRRGARGPHHSRLPARRPPGDARNRRPARRGGRARAALGRTPAAAAPDATSSSSSVAARWGRRSRAGSALAARWRAATNGTENGWRRPRPAYGIRRNATPGPRPPSWPSARNSGTLDPSASAASASSQCRRHRRGTTPSAPAYEPGYCRPGNGTR